MISKPSNLVYGLNDKPSFFISTLMSFQHFFIFAISLVFPVILAREMNASLDQTVGLVCMSMFAGGAGTLFQGLKGKYLGSGYLCPSVCSPSFMSASLLAVKSGGLSLLFGMLLLSGFAESLFSRIIHRLKILFPPEVTGLIVTMVGISVVKLSVSNFLGVGGSDQVISWQEVLTGMLTLCVIIGLNVWSKGKIKLFCVLIGMLFGYGLAYGIGIMKNVEHAHLLDIPLAGFELLRHPGWSFSWYLVVPFIIAMLSSTLKSVGDLTTCQKINDRNWKRTDMMNVRKGILADALSCLSAGLVGGSAQSTSSANVGLSLATGTTSRKVAMYFGTLLIVFSFFPPIALFFAIMPKPVMGATLIFAVSFMIAAGIQIITSRMLDARKIFVIGISMILGLSVDIRPEFFQHLHPFIQPVFSSSLATATVLAIILNLVLRLGIAKKDSIQLIPDTETHDKIETFLDKNGAAWGARREVIRKLKQSLFELIEILSDDHYASSGREISIHLSFDELKIIANVCYQGKKIDFNIIRPAPDDLLLDEYGTSRMSIYLVNAQADHIRQSSAKQTQHIALTFEH